MLYSKVAKTASGNCVVNCWMNQDWINSSSCTCLELLTAILSKHHQKRCGSSEFKYSGVLQGLKLWRKAVGLSHSLWEGGWEVARGGVRCPRDHQEPAWPEGAAEEPSLLYFSDHTLAFWREESHDHCIAGSLLLVWETTEVWLKWPEVVAGDLLQPQ